MYFEYIESKWAHMQSHMLLRSRVITVHVVGVFSDENCL